MIKKLKTTKDFNSERSKQGLKVGVINMGCARNLVDSQVILGQMKKEGHRIVDIEQSDIAIINTCGFIEDAKKESIDTIMDLLELKKQGKLKKVIVAGCLAERYGKELAKEFKDIDEIYGVQKLDKKNIPDQVSLTPAHFAYLKICESCYNRCSFCIIPKIKGKFVSRTFESIVEEVKRLDKRGVRELNIIGQDITAYGMDVYHKKSLARLLKEISKNLINIEWVRLLYAFPAHVTDELIDVIAQESRICKYIDMPLQHISDNILKNMNRGINTKQTRDLVMKIRQKIPGASLRTTFIVGLPGETEENFAELVSFVREVRFEKMGVFVYSQEEGTPAATMIDQVPEKIKKKRMNILMKIQKDISRDVMNSFIGRTIRVVIEESANGEKNVYLGRSEYDAPEVDGIVYVHTSKKLYLGDFVNVKITDAYEYDLVGNVV